MDTSTRWADLATGWHDGRLDWAVQEYHDFITDLAPAVRASLPAERPRAAAALYGATQVGKTTLLLTMLGIRPELIEDVGNALRADRPPGQSATPTATRYRPSEGEHWTWRADDGDPRERLSEAELRARIMDVRRQVEAGRWPLARVVEIGLPASCFAGPDANPPQVIDLPGVNAVNAAENRHARLLIDTWLSRCDIVLLVSRVASLTPLHPDALRVDPLRYWPRQLRKFRVVLTHTYADQTTSEWLKQAPPEELTLSTLRGQLRDDLGPVGGTGPGWQAAAWLYPLELGKSWKTFVDSHPGTPAIAMRDEALRQLMSDVERSAMPEARLQRAFEAKDAAEAVRDSRLKEFDGALARAEKAVQRFRRTADRLRQLARRCDEDLRELSEAIEVIDDLGVPRLKAHEAGRTITNVRAALVEAARDSWAAWRAMELAARRRLPGTPDLELPPIRDADVHERATAIVEKSMGRVRQPKLFKRTLVKRLAHAGAEATGRLHELLAGAAGERTTALREAIAEAKARVAARARRTDAGLREVERRISTAVEQAHSIRTSRASTLELLDEHCRIAGEFPARLEARYLRRRAELLDAVARAGEPLAALAASVAVLDCTRAYDSLKRGE